MDNIQYCQMIIKSEPYEIDPLKSYLSSFELQVRTEVEDDACNQSKIQDTKDDSKQDNSNTSCDEFKANVGKKVTVTKVKEIEGGRLKKIVENRKTKKSRISKENLEHPCSFQERSEIIVKSFMPGDKGSFTPIHYKGVVIMKEPNKRCYDLRREDLDKFKREIDYFIMYCCEDCAYTTEYFDMFKVHFMTHANMKFLIECINTSTKLYCCYLCDFKCSDSEELEQHINVHRNKSMIELNEKSMDDSEVVQPMVDRSTVPLDDASNKTESTSPASNENMQNPNANGMEDSEKPKRFEKYSISRRKEAAEKNNGVKKSKNLTVKVRERHVDELRPNVTESSGVSLNGKSFRIEIISAAENSKSIQNVNESSENITKDRRQTSRQLKTYSKRSPVVDMMNVIRNSEYENFDEEADYYYDDGNDFHDVQEDAVDNSAPQDAMLSCHVEVMRSCIVKIENDPDIAAAVCSNDKVYFKITNDNQKIRLTKIPSELQRRTCERSNACHLCGKICRNVCTLKQHINSHQGNVIIPLNDKQSQCGVCRIYIKTEEGLLSKHICKEVRQCDMCDEILLNQRTYRYHRKLHFCDKCSFKSANLHEVSEHRKTSTDCWSKCTNCDFKTMNMNSFQRHLKTKTCFKDKSIKMEKSAEMLHCDTCAYKTKYKDILIKHMKQHRNEKYSNQDAFMCNLCGKSCYSRSTLTTHYKSHYCYKCTFMSLNTQDVLEHKKANPNCLYKCDNCNFTTSHTASLRRHVKLYCGKFNPDEQTDESQACMAPGRGGMKGRRLRFSCDQCNYRTHSKANLTWHIMKHSDPKPFQCSKCDFKCSQRGNLLMHEKKHIDGKTYCCNVCDFQSSYYQVFLTHKKIHSEEETETKTEIKERDPRFYYCDRCEFRTKYPQYLRYHNLKHDNIRPYLCDYCGNTYSSLIDYHAHKNNAHKIRRPKKKKIYKCSYCDYSYSNKKTVTVHERKHTGAKPHSCELCSYCTSYAGNLRAHRKKHLIRNEIPFANP